MQGLRIECYAFLMKRFISVLVSLGLVVGLVGCGVLPRIPLISSGAENGDAGDDTFLQVEDAENRASELGCSGVHEHLIDGKTWHMPCSDHAEWMRLTGDNHDHDEGLIDGLREVLGCLKLLTSVLLLSHPLLPLAPRPLAPMVRVIGAKFIILATLFELFRL